MKFHDGTTLEMADVLHTLTTAFTPDELEFPEVKDELQGRTLGNAQTVQVYMKDWDAVDEGTLAMHLNFPSIAFLTTFATYRFPILSKDAIASTALSRYPTKVPSLAQDPTCSLRYDKDIVTELERKPDYHLQGGHTSTASASTP